MNNMAPGHTYRAGVMGASGTVGQRFVELLLNHPYFELTKLGASAASKGKRYGDVWRLPTELPETIANLPLDDANDVRAFKDSCDIIFSAVGADVASELEPRLAQEGLKVFSNAGVMRRHPAVPILIASVNPDHLSAVKSQPWGPGFIVCNSNCSVAGLAVVLAPLREVMPKGTKVVVATMQALSGAGYPGVPSLDIIDNVIPFIEGEEEKMAFESRKILGSSVATPFEDLPVTAMCHRVNVSDGHTLAVCFQLPEEAAAAAATNLLAEVTDKLKDFEFTEVVKKLPSAPVKPLQVLEGKARPQPRLDRNRGRGLTVSVGRLRASGSRDICLNAVVHNTALGAAAGSVLNAELAAAQGLL